MTTSSEYDEVAAALAAQIARSAIWHGERCNWVGVVPRDAAQDGGRTTREALGPDLYNGTAGVALFLAEAAMALGDAALARGARGAISHALHHAARAGEDGLHAGQPGIAYAAARVARAMDCELALTGARELMAGWRARRDPAGAWDVVGGRAGTVAALVALSDLLDDETLLEVAATAGDELIAGAERSAGGWLWPDPRQPATHGLCGFSHGAAGIGHALVELFGATAEVRFREAALAAFAYERSWFEQRGGTWPDLREIDRRAGRDVPAPESPTWCQGAPGIALSRLRAARLLESRAMREDAGARAMREDAGAALAATRRHLAGLSTRAPDDFSLCHGAAGASDVLLYSADESGLAARIGDAGIARHHMTGAGFPCGTPLGETPGLFIGLAGIGLFYLRLSNPNIHTVLVIHRNIP